MCFALVCVFVLSCSAFLYSLCLVWKHFLSASFRPGNLSFAFRLNKGTKQVSILLFTFHTFFLILDSLFVILNAISMVKNVLPNLTCFSFLVYFLKSFNAMEKCQNTGFLKKLYSFDVFCTIQYAYDFYYHIIL